MTAPPTVPHGDAPTPVSIPRTEVHTLHSEQVGEEFEVWIAHPVGGPMGLPEGPVAVLYVLDANLVFGTAVEMSRLMHQLYGELPPLLVVGIAYPTDDPRLQAELRARDFTPTVDAEFERMAGSIPGAPEPTLPEGKRLGGAAAFLSFLQDTVRPYVEARFDVAPDRSSLSGASLGGLFALYAMLRDPGSFDAFLATSPAIWWDGDHILGLEDELAQAGRTLETQLVLAVGAGEERADIPMLARFRMVSNVRLLAERLSDRGYPGLRVSTHVLEGESHTSVIAPALSRGLREVYARP